VSPIPVDRVPQRAEGRRLRPRVGCHLRQGAALIEGHDRTAAAKHWSTANTEDLMLPRVECSSVVLKVDQLSLGRSLQDVSFEARAGRSARHLRLHGLRTARAVAHPASAS